MPSNGHDSLVETEDHVGNLLDSAVRAKDRAKEKTQQLLSPPPAVPPSHDEDDIFSDVAFDPARVLHGSPPKQKKSAHDTIRDGLKSTKYLIAHPRRLMRNKATHVAADQLGNRHPLLTIDRDRELLEAHDALDQVVSSNTSDSEDDVFVELEANARVRRVEQQRESLQAAWILGRHVSRVKVVRPLSRPDRSRFDKQDRFEWERYLAYMALYYTRNFTAAHIDDFSSPPFDLEDLARIVERISISSTPWQSFLVNVRHVYMWKDPKRTAKWLALFCVLWYTQYIVTYVYLWIIYKTLSNRFGEHSVQTVRETVDRAVDRETRVQAWGDLIQRHGQHDWLEPFLDQIGPIIQLQLGDLADLLEMLVNFHRWERPRSTLATIFYFSCCLTVSLCADMAFCVKLVWLIAGSGFFLTFPIATNFPKYRLLVSHWRWMFWDIPTHAELALLRLQEKVAKKEVLSEYDKDDQDGLQQKQSPDREGYSFKVYDKAEGRSQLTVNRTNFTLVAKSGLERTWPFSSLSEIRKLDDIDVRSASKVKNLTRLHSRSAEVLQFLFIDSKELAILLHPSDRDRVFNLVLAWSGQAWQCLRMERHSGMDSERSNLDRAIKRALH